MKDTKRKYVEKDDGTIKMGFGPTMKKSTYRNQRKLRDAYVKENYRQFNIKIKKNNADVIKWMEEQDNLFDYITELVRSDMYKQLKKQGKLTPEMMNPPEKRDVGRPKKVRTDEVEKKAAEKKSERKTVSSKKETEEKTKRRVGRPKKNKLEELEQNIPVGSLKRGSVDSEKNTEEKKKRSVGRPKKIAVEDSEKNTVVKKIKAKRGRPKKTEETPVAEQPKRRVGRPKKVNQVKPVETEKAKKRK